MVQADLIARYRGRNQIGSVVDHKRYIDANIKPTRNTPPKTAGRRIGRRR